MTSSSTARSSQTSPRATWTPSPRSSPRSSHFKQPLQTRIPLVDLAAQYQEIRGEVEPVVLDILARGAFTLGEELRAFEAAFAAYCGVAHAIGVGSGTDALFLALRALNLQPGDEVIVPSTTFAATAEAVAYCGATPVFVDVTADDLLMDPAAAEAAITGRTVGLLPVHLYGLLADVEALGAIAERHNFWLIEDAAQAHGATLPSGVRAGSFGIAGCFSFYPSKNIGAYGDGGIVTTSNASLADRLRLLRHHGQRDRYEHVEVGYCSRLDNLQAAILSVKLRHLDTWNAARRRAAGAYDHLIGDRLVCVGRGRRGPDGVQYVYVVRILGGRRDAVAASMRAQGVDTGVHYPQALHQLSVFGTSTAPQPTLPMAEQAAAEVLSIPLYPEITPAQQEQVVHALFAALDETARPS